MGHASISTTTDFYSTVSEEHNVRAQWVVEAITVGRQRTTDAKVTPERETRPIRKVG